MIDRGQAIIPSPNHIDIQSCNTRFGRAIELGRTPNRMSARRKTPPPLIRQRTSSQYFHTPLFTGVQLLPLSVNRKTACYGRGGGEGRGLGVGATLGVGVGLGVGVALTVAVAVGVGVAVGVDVGVGVGVGVTAPGKG